MLVNKALSREWKPTETSGVERSLFRNNDAGGRSSVVRLKKQARVSPATRITATRKWSSFREQWSSAALSWMRVTICLRNRARNTMSLH